jgi:uncharacterized membrane protein
LGQDELLKIVRPSQSFIRDVKHSVICFSTNELATFQTRSASLKELMGFRICCWVVVSQANAEHTDYTRDTPLYVASEVSVAIRPRENAAVISETPVQPFSGRRRTNSRIQFTYVATTQPGG